ncbi:GNAT family N-acetyltransferase [Nocardioides dongxiaopingii]|uniref:GNAT family N-acetyltransferase n=1 Tax=Nocardioides sp. S-1144 TaxID=2582905 RepID=UPI00110DBD91|nr:GNAT family N-acetyltransferase [Nocardioides sp. S-1144]QCW51420.1 GNAT family N-acetyltransferase [Nocardioides sp. S-1144]
MEIRRLTLDDHDQTTALGREAFGSLPPGTPAPARPTTEPTDRRVWGAFRDGRLLGRVAAYPFASFFGGASVPTSGIASVAVAAEERGGGLLGELFAAMLEEAAGLGEVVSTLYPTANGIYRSLGYELVGSYDVASVPTAELARVRPPTATRTRRATVADVPAVRALYAAWAAEQDGPLTRTGPAFAEGDEEVLGEHDAVTLAVDADDRVVGYAAWDRGHGYDAGASITVQDLLATTLDGYRALWSMFATFSSVTGRVRVRTSGQDPARLVLGTSTWDLVERHPYMLRVCDVVGALDARRVSVPGLAAEVGFAVAGDRFGSTDGAYRLALGDGPGRCTRTSAGDDVPTFTPQGLAMLYAGAQSCGNLRLTSHLTGPRRHDHVLDAALGGRPFHVRDYF